MFSLPFLLKGVAAPAVAAFALALLMRRLWGGGRGVGAIAFAAGQTLGTAWLLFGSGDVWPTRNLHWPPWVAVAAALLGPTLVVSGLIAVERWLLTLGAAAVAAVVLVPAWPDLWPPRAYSLGLFALTATVLARSLDSLIHRSSPRIIAVLMAGSAISAAMLIAAALSLSLGEATLTTAAALTGTAIALSFRSDEAAVRGLCLPYALGVGGWCYVTAIEPPPPEPPLLALLFIPAAPLVLWLTAVGPLSRWSPRCRLAVEWLLWLAGIAALSAWLLFGGDSGSDY